MPEVRDIRRRETSSAQATSQAVAKDSVPIYHTGTKVMLDGSCTKRKITLI
jgi:hypothetical protein